MGVVNYEPVRHNDECPLGIEEEGESKTLLEVVNTLNVRTLKGTEYKQYSRLLKRLEEINLLNIDVTPKTIESMNLSLKVMSKKSNAIVSSYKLDGEGRSVDGSNKLIGRQTMQDLTKQPRAVCPCSLNDDFREDSTYESPKCFMVLSENSNPQDLEHKMKGSMCRKVHQETLTYYHSLRVYHTSAVLEYYWQTLNLPTIAIRRGEVQFMRDSQLTLRISDNGEMEEAFFSNNKDHRSTGLFNDGVCTDCHSSGFQCVTKAKKNNTTKTVLGQYFERTLEYAGWNEESYDMVGLEQSWNQPKYLMNLKTEEIRTVRGWSLEGFKCRPTWKFTLVKVETNDGKINSPSEGFGWAKFIATDEIVSEIEKNGGIVTDLPTLGILEWRA